MLVMSYSSAAKLKVDKGSRSALGPPYWCTEVYKKDFFLFLVQVFQAEETGDSFLLGVNLQLSDNMIHLIHLNTIQFRFH